MVVLDVQSQGSLWAPTSSWNLFNFDFYIDSLQTKVRQLRWKVVGLYKSFNRLKLLTYLDSNTGGKSHKGDQIQNS